VRANHSAAILDQMGLADLVTENMEDYIALAVRLARDAEFRAEVRGRIAAGKGAVYRNETCIRALEDFLDRVCRAHSPA
jgi:protein O-GlcNAc transferase